MLTRKYFQPFGAHLRVEGTTLGVAPRSFYDFLARLRMDSHGNLYTGEVDSGKRVQKFVPVSGVPGR